MFLADNVEMKLDSSESLLIADKENLRNEKFPFLVVAPVWKNQNPKDYGLLVFLMPKGFLYVEIVSDDDMEFFAANSRLQGINDSESNARGDDLNENFQMSNAQKVEGNFAQFAEII